VLAFDFGEKRIGVAMGETTLKTAHPLQTINAEVNLARFAEIEKLITECKTNLLIVGLPTYLDGKAHALTQLSKKFAQRLEGRFNLPVMMIDERLSSAEASQNLTTAGVKAREQKTLIDAVAAQVILQSYLDQSPIT
jgi:putative Holliday junction resolvase